MTKLFVTTDFSESLSEKLEQFISGVQEQSKLQNGKVELFIDSPGGLVTVLKSFLMVFDLAKSEGVTVATYVMGQAASAGSLLAAAGTPGHRYIYKYGEHYIHYGMTPSYPTNPEEAERAAQYAKNHFKWVQDMYMEHGKFTRPQLHKLMQDEYGRLTATDAIKYGLADKIVGEK